MLYNACEPLNFVTANGQPLEGGKRCINLHLGFRQVIDGRDMPDFKWFTDEFYEADIKVDAILAFPWMVKHKVGVFPHHHALAMDRPCLVLLFGLAREKEHKNQNKNKRNWNSKQDHINYSRGDPHWEPRIQRVEI